MIVSPVFHKTVRAGVIAAAVAGGAGQANALTTVANDVYEVRIQSKTEAFSIGSWTAFTKAGHPAGPGNDLLFREVGGVSSQTTNFSSLRVYGDTGSTTDYSFGGQGGGIDMDPFVTGVPVTGAPTLWDIAPEMLTVAQDVVIAGSTFDDSAIYHTVEITNYGNTTKNIGWRNLYDWKVDIAPGSDIFTDIFDDGPSNQIELSDGTVVPGFGATTTEFSYTPTGDDLVRIATDEPGGADYEPLLTLGFDPGLLLPWVSVTQPDEFALVSWTDAKDTAFDFILSGIDVTGDSAGLSWFGRDLASAIELAPGQDIQLTQVLFSHSNVVPGVPEPLTAALSILGFGAMGIRFRRRRLVK